MGTDVKIEVEKLTSIQYETDWIFQKSVNIIMKD